MGECVRGGRGGGEVPGRKANILSAHTVMAVLVFSSPFLHFYGVKHLFRLVGA